MQTISVQYRFIPEKGLEQIFDLRFDEESLDLVSEPGADLPSWTDLGFHKCPHCPLNNPPHARCPMAVQLVDMVSRFEDLVSYEKIHLIVTTVERTVSQITTAQRAISSLAGLISATSGCPHTAFFRPMARFHLPLASEDETVYRAVSMYLMGQYFLKSRGYGSDNGLGGLRELYARIGTVNQYMTKRLKAASDTDSTVNAIILLDVYAKAVPFVIEDSLEGISRLFRHFFAGCQS